MREKQLQEFINATLAMGEAHKEDIELMNDIIIADVKYRIENNLIDGANHTPGSSTKRKSKEEHRKKCLTLESAFHHAKCALFLQKDESGE